MDSAGNYYQGIYNQSNLTIDAGELVITGLTDNKVVGQTGGHLVTAGVSTDWLSEGANLYFTTARARAAFSATLPMALTAGIISLNYTANLRLTGSGLDTVQDIRTVSGPQFARLASSSLGTQNVLYGDNAGGSITTGAYNAAIGGGALQACSIGSHNLAIGYQALYQCIDSHNIALGDTAGFNITTGNDNILIGSSAGRGTYALTTGSHNAYIGYSAQPSDTAATYEIVIGTGIGAGSNTAKIYASAGLYVSNLTSGILKATAGLISTGATTDDLTEGKTNLYFTTARATAAITAAAPIVVTAGVVSIGYNTSNLKITASQLNTTQDITTSSSPQFARLASSSLGTYNVILGTNAAPGFAGDRSVIIGDGAVSVASSAIQTVAIGNNALNVCTGSTNTAVGAQAGYNVTSGNSNVLLGCNSGGGATPLTTGTFNVLIGPNANTSSASAFKEIVIGAGTGAGDNTAKIYASAGLYISNLTTGILKATAGLVGLAGASDYVASVAAVANQTTVSGSGALTIGTVQDIGTASSPQFRRLLNSSLGTSNVLVGTGSGGSITTALYNVGVGESALSAISSAIYCSALGHQALQNNTANGNSAFGFQAGKNLITGTQNTLFGTLAGQQLNTGSYNHLFGTSAGYNMTSAASNICVGVNSGYSITSSTHNIAIGNYAMAGTGPLTQATAQNVALGNYSMFTLGSSGNSNVAVGYQTMWQATTAYNNVILGHNSAAVLTTGYNNTIIGANSGQNLTGGLFNIHIGAGCQASGVGVSSEIIIAGTSGTTVGKGAGTCYISSPYGLYYYSPAYCHLVSTAFTGGTVTWAFYNDGTTTYNQGFTLYNSNTLIVQPFAGLYEINITGNMLNTTNYSQINIFPTNLPGYSPAFNSPAVSSFVGTVSTSVLSRPYVSGTPTSTGWTIGFPGGNHYASWPARMTIKFISL